VAIAKVLFTTETLAILNMLDSGESVHYNWAVDEDYSIVLVEGSITINGIVLSNVQEHRVQPNTNLDATCESSERAYFITLFDATRDSLMDQIISADSKTKLKTYAPSWHDNKIPSTEDVVSNWESEFNSGNLVFSKSDIDTQIATTNE